MIKGKDTEREERRGRKTNLMKKGKVDVLIERKVEKLAFRAKWTFCEVKFDLKKGEKRSL